MRTILATLLCATALFAADPGQRAPGFALMDHKGELHDLYDFRGKPLVLEFMVTGCPHCAALIPTLKKLRAKYGDKVGIVAIANPPDTFATVATFIQGHQIDYPVLFDMGQVAYSYIRQMQFDQPQVYLIDAKGNIFNHYAYSALTKDFFEGDGLVHEVDRMFASSAPAASKPAVSKAAPKK
jgi:peroxiredoxin